MNPDAKLAADTLRKMADFKQMLAFPHDTGKIINACADLIESLAAELEQVKRERDEAWKVVESISGQNEVMADALERVKRERNELAEKRRQLEARNDTLIAKEVLFDEAIAAGAKMQRERDAAVEDLRGACAFCAHVRDCLVTGCSEDMGEACKQCPCNTCAHDSNWQWRGVKED